MPKNNSPEALEFYNKGVDAIQKNNKDEAVKYWKKAIESNPALGLEVETRRNLAIALSPEFIEIPEGSTLSEDQTERFHFVEKNLMRLAELLSGKAPEGPVKDLVPDRINAGLETAKIYWPLLFRAEKGWYIFPGDETAQRIFEYGMGEANRGNKQEGRDALIRALELLDENNTEHKKMLLKGSVRIAALSNDLHDLSNASKFANQAISYGLKPDDMEFIMMKVILERAGEKATPTTTESSKGGCFIATAVYESENKLEVLIFKSYRDIILINHVLGKLFIKIYYLISPVLANCITKLPKIKYYTREKILNPLSKYCLLKLHNHKK